MQGLTCCFMPALVLIRLGYLFVVQVFPPTGAPDAEDCRRDAETLVLRHEVAALRHQVTRPTYI